MTDRTPLTTDQLDDIETRTATLWEYATLTDGPLQADANQLTGEDVPALLAEVRRLRAENAATEQQPPSDDHAALYVDQDGDPWAEYLTSPRSGHVVGLVLARHEAVGRRELEDRIGPLTLVGWHRQA